MYLLLCCPTCMVVGYRVSVIDRYIISIDISFNHIPTSLGKHVGSTCGLAKNIDSRMQARVSPGRFSAQATATFHLDSMSGNMTDPQVHLRSRDPNFKMPSFFAHSLSQFR